MPDTSGALAFECKWPLRIGIGNIPGPGSGDSELKGKTNCANLYCPTLPLGRSSARDYGRLYRGPASPADLEPAEVADAHRQTTGFPGGSS